MHVSASIVMWPSSSAFVGNPFSSLRLDCGGWCACLLVLSKRPPYSAEYVLAIVGITG